MAPTVFYSVTILFLFTTVNGASIKSDMNDINNLIPEKCREPLLTGNRSKRRNYCTEQPDVYLEVIQKEIEERIAADLSAIGVPPQRTNAPPLTDDDCTSVDAEQNCCTKSGWEKPSSIILKGELAMVVQSKHLVQQVKTVECANEGAVCFSNLDFLKRIGHVTECKTDYAYQKVYVYYTQRKTFTWAYIRTPVSCSCVISRRSTMDYPFIDSPQNDDFEMDDSFSRNF